MQAATGTVVNGKIVLEGVALPACGLRAPLMSNPGPHINKTAVCMKPLAPLAFASILLVSACASSPQDEVGAQTPVAASSTSSVHDYRCESGETIAATYPSTESATVQYKGDNYNMRIAVSGSGSRYVGGGLEWWTKGSGPGSEATLFRHMADGTSGESIELCTES